MFCLSRENLGNWQNRFIIIIGQILTVKNEMFPSIGGNVSVSQICTRKKNTEFDTFCRNITFTQWSSTLGKSLIRAIALLKVSLKVSRSSCVEQNDRLAEYVAACKVRSRLVVEGRPTRRDGRLRLINYCGFSTPRVTEGPSVPSCYLGAQPDEWCPDKQPVACRVTRAINICASATPATAPRVFDASLS